MQDKNIKFSKSNSTNENAIPRRQDDNIVKINALSEKEHHQYYSEESLSSEEPESQVNIFGPKSIITDEAILRQSQIEVHPTSSNLQTTLCIMKYYLSLGILALPYVFYMTGIGLGSVIIIGVTLMTSYSVNLVHEINVEMSEKGEAKINYTYPAITLSVLGPKGQFFCTVFSFIASMGACVTYISFFVMYISSIIHEKWSHHIEDTQAHLIGALSAFVVILPLSQINNIALFWHSNFLGLFFGLLSILLMIFSDLSVIISTGNIQFDQSNLWQPEHFWFSIGIAVYSFKIMGISMIIRSNMDNPLHFPKVFNFSTYFTAALYLTYAIITTLTLGEYVEDISLHNYTSYNVLGFLVRIFYITAVLLSYPLRFFMVVVIYENLKCFKDNFFCKEIHEHRDHEHKFQTHFATLKRYAFRYLVIVIIFMITLITTKLTNVISLIGSLGGIMNQFLLPQIIYLKYRPNISKFRKFISISIACFCVFASVIGMYRSLEKMF